MTHDESRSRRRQIWFAHKAGTTIEQLARAHGVSREYVHRIVRKSAPVNAPFMASYDAPTLIQQMHQWCEPALVVKLRARRAKRSPGARELRMIEMYRAGLTLQQIGDRYGVSRERVRQLLRIHGVDPEQGGSHKRGQHRKAVKVADKDRRAMARWGCSYAEYQAIRAAGGVRAYRYQQISAKYRALSFTLTLKQWWDLWQQSGHWAQRGRGANSYCMARVKDRGGYDFGNVYITTCRENGQEYQMRRQGHRAAVTGVYHIMPGYRKGWLARYASKSLGYFETPEEASAARDAYIATLPPRKRKVA